MFATGGVAEMTSIHARNERATYMTTASSEIMHQLSPPSFIPRQGPHNMIDTP